MNKIKAKLMIITYMTVKNVITNIQKRCLSKLLLCTRWFTAKFLFTNGLIKTVKRVTQQQM